MDDKYLHETGVTDAVEVALTALLAELMQGRAPSSPARWLSHRIRVHQEEEKKKRRNRWLREQLLEGQRKKRSLWKHIVTPASDLALRGDHKGLLMLMALGEIADPRRLGDGATPLHVAAQLPLVDGTTRKHYLDVVDVLLRAKADVTLRDRGGKTPLDLAREKDFSEAVTLLETVRSAASQASRLCLAHPALHTLLHTLPSQVNNAAAQASSFCWKSWSKAQAACDVQCALQTLGASGNPDGQERTLIGFVGATSDFCMLGHAAMRHIEAQYPAATLRLGLPEEIATCPPIVADLQASGKLTYMTWPRGTYECRLTSCILHPTEYILRLTSYTSYTESSRM